MAKGMGKGPPWDLREDQARKLSLSSSSSSSLSSSQSSPIHIEWQPLAPLGPQAAFHVGCLIRGNLYLHGGFSERKSSQPSNQLFKLNLRSQSTMWETVRTPGSPALSHHACVVSEDRYMILIGGWNGKRRCADVHVYDAQEDQWLSMKHRGFPDGAGLSSHTASILINRDILIIGREGSLRIQNKRGNAYLLSGNVLSGQFVYKEYSDNVTSRSGHTAHVISNSVFIIGGRSDNLLEKATGFKPQNQSQCSILSTLLQTIITNRVKPMAKLPCGRKNHIAAADHDCILVHGGETFDGRNREPVGEMFIISLASPTSFYKLNTSCVRRAGHVCCVSEDGIFIHGGLTGQSTMNSDLYQLKILSGTKFS